MLYQCASHQVAAKDVFRPRPSSIQDSLDPPEALYLSQIVHFQLFVQPLLVDNGALEASIIPISLTRDQY